MTRRSVLGLTLIAAIVAIIMSHAQAQHQAPQYSYPPLSFGRAQYYQQHPREFQQLLQRLLLASRPIPPGKKLAPGGVPAGASWTSLTNNPGVNLSNPLLLTDGTVIAHESCTGTWHKLTPDNTGSYLNGTWSTIASMPIGYAPRFFGSAVLPDGRVIIEGGEYNTLGCTIAVTNLGAIYDPVADTWTVVPPPNGWTFIGDAAGVVLDNGTYMQSDCCNQPPKAALLNPNTLTWTPTGSNKFDSYEEEGFAKLPDGTVLDVDAYSSTGTCGKNSEIYNPATGAWSSAGNTIHQQADCSGNQTYELGPLVMRPNGTAVIFPGVTTGAVTADIYDFTSKTWSSGTTIPSVGGTPYTLADAPVIAIVGALRQPVQLGAAGHIGAALAQCGCDRGDDRLPTRLVDAGGGVDLYVRIVGADRQDLAGRQQQEVYLPGTNVCRVRGVGDLGDVAAQIHFKEVDRTRILIR